MKFIGLVVKIEINGSYILKVPIFFVFLSIETLKNRYYEALYTLNTLDI